MTRKRLSNYARLGFACILIAGIAYPKEKKAPDADKKPKASTAKAIPAQSVNVNTATQKELEDLPGVGPATAKKIIANRPYSSASDLAKAGVPASTVTKITPMLTWSQPKASSPKSSEPLQKPAVFSQKSSPSPSSTTPPSSIDSKSKTNSGTSPSSARTYSPPPSPGMVWVNEDTKIFHRQGDRWYGKTKKGKYMTEADASKAGYRESKEK